MNEIIFPEDVLNVIQSFMACNDGDESTQSLIISIGAELLDVSTDRLIEMMEDYR